MSHSPDQASELIIQAKSELMRRSERLLHLFSIVPDDKLTWSPSPTAKSALRIVGHCGLTFRFFASAITGRLPESMPPVEEFFKNLREDEERITTREEAIALVEETTGELLQALDTVTAENITLTVNSPFGPLPIHFWLQQGSEQLAAHSGQLEYLQTIWGDLDNHL